MVSWPWSAVSSDSIWTDGSGDASVVVGEKGTGGGEGGGEGECGSEVIVVTVSVGAAAAATGCGERHD